MPPIQEQADTLYQQGRFPAARAAYQQILAQRPGDRAALTQLGTLALWDNDTEQALNYLQQAYDQGGWWSRRWPLRAQLAYRIGSAHARRDDYAQAAQWYGRAVGPWAIGPLKTVQAMQRQLQSFGTSPPYQISGPAITRLRFLQLDPLPVVEVMLNDRGPYHFFIDTGGADLIVVAGLAQELGLQSYGEFSGSFAGGKRGLVKLSRAASLRVGETVVRNLPVHIMGLEGIDSVFGRKVHGAIGTSLLRRFYTTLDYVNQALVLRQVNAGNRAEVEAMATRGTAIPFWLVEQHMVMARGHINDLPDTLLFVDTGLADRGFLASRATQEAAGIAIDWSRAREGVGGGGAIKSVDFTLDRVTLGEGAHSFTQVQVPASIAENDLEVFTGALGFGVGGLVSHAFFKETALTLDFETMRLVITGAH